MFTALYNYACSLRDIVLMNLLAHGGRVFGKLYIVMFVEIVGVGVSLGRRYSVRDIVGCNVYRRRC